MKTIFKIGHSLTHNSITLASTLHVKEVNNHSHINDPLGHHLFTRVKNIHS